ncbi:hypothetical protein EI42_02636 [Thermosporothrix hazakensis]|jgi:carbon monoxide dehydrogenase subunit G|uniref:Carbon monoxide dehydrogenase subunit G n=1 Tax=Thermosporothrix hazakensis TaxID=644383 RepID=A0A326U9F8_THEHA|nr:carbon monoxide dehydrogenase subunit G [Thermosporothrix hazakensis]PZW30662.1 hypothetical protein EI42_02636 [Thermosporothrix hazakensis]
MEFSGSQTIAAPIEKVWSFLLDANNVFSCAPGFQSMEVLGEEHWKALISVGVGPVKAKFTMDVTRPEMQEPEVMLVKARGKAPGSAVDLSGKMNLSVLDDTHTKMDWSAQVNISGTIASVGARLIKGTADKVTSQFFQCLRQKLESGEA